jgi:hypothetical protein
MDDMTSNWRSTKLLLEGRLYLSIQLLKNSIPIMKESFRTVSVNNA